MKNHLLLAFSAAALVAAQAPDPDPAPLTPGDVVAAMTAADWRPIAPENLLIMTLGNGAEVMIELAPDFAPVHVENIRRLARAHWFDEISVNRVQDNYVVQWGDASGEKALPDGIVAEPPAEYSVASGADGVALQPQNALEDVYASWASYLDGWPVAANTAADHWLAHCYGMVGVGRGGDPDTGTGAELYTVIGNAPRHLDRNIALVGRIVEGIESLSSLPRGTGTLGFYETAEERVPIATVRLASELPASARPQYEVMNSDTAAFRAYVTARANRTGWFVRPAGAVDVCNVNLPIRRIASD